MVLVFQCVIEMLVKCSISKVRKKSPPITNNWSLCAYYTIEGKSTHTKKTTTTALCSHTHSTICESDRLRFHFSLNRSVDRLHGNFQRHESNTRTYSSTVPSCWKRHKKSVFNGKKSTTYFMVSIAHAQ